MQDIWQLLAQKQNELVALQIEFAAAKDRYLSLKTNSESGVCRWEWSSSLPRYELDPLYFLNDSSRRGKATNNQPKIINHKHQYGFDSSGRIVVGRNHTEFPGQFYEQFFLYGPSEIDSLLYDYSASKDPINCSRLTLANEIPASFHSRAKYGAQSHVYIPQAGMIHYFCSLHAPDGREAFGGSGELSFPDGDVVELWHTLMDGTRKLSFSGPCDRYNTLAGLMTVGANNSFKPRPLRGSA